MSRVNFMNVVIAMLVISVCVAALLTSGCTVSTSFKGPGYDPDQGVTLEEAGDTVIVSLTHAVIGGPERDKFRERSSDVVDELDTTPGLIGYSLRMELFGDNFWTMTAWTSDKALNDFIYSKTHMRAMREGSAALRPESSVYSFEMPASELPLKWERALELLEQEGYSDFTRYQTYAD